MFYRINICCFIFSSPLHRAFTEHDPILRQSVPFDFGTWKRTGRTDFITGNNLIIRSLYNTYHYTYSITFYLFLSSLIRLWRWHLLSSYQNSSAVFLVFQSPQNYRLQKGVYMNVTIHASLDMQTHMVVRRSMQQISVTFSLSHWWRYSCGIG